MDTRVDKTATHDMVISYDIITCIVMFINRCSSDFFLHVLPLQKCYWMKTSVKAFWIQINHLGSRIATEEVFHVAPGKMYTPGYVLLTLNYLAG
jgi:hypothetical protein